MQSISLHQAPGADAAAGRSRTASGRTVAGGAKLPLDLAGCSLSSRRLAGADLRGAQLRCADLARCCLRRASLRGADLSCADLRRADLRGADLCAADLAGADLSGADLRCASLKRVRLRGARWDAETRWPAGFEPSLAAAAVQETAPAERRRWPWLLAAALMLLDQAAKQAAAALIPAGGPGLDCFQGSLFITHVLNPGALMSLGEGWPAAAGLVTSAAFVAAVIYFAPALALRSAARPGLAAGAALLVGGGLSNFVDRARLGAVIDYLGVASGTVFNLADAAIIGGILCMILCSERPYPGRPQVPARAQ